MNRTRRSAASILVLLITFALGVTPGFAAHHEEAEGESAPATPGGDSVSKMIEDQLGQIPSPDEVLAQLQTDLGLSAEQAEAIRPIVNEMSASLGKSVDQFKAGTIPPMGLVMQLQNTGNKAAKQIETHLDPDQVTKYTQMRLEQRQAMMRQFMKAQSATRASQ
jgi:hypothetical protein